MDLKYRIILLLVIFLSSRPNFAKRIHNPNNLLRFLRQTYKKEGIPSLYNCAGKESKAREAPLPLNFELTLSPRWSVQSEYREEPEILQKYTWSYRMVKEIERKGRKVDKLIDVNKFIEPEANDSLTFKSYTLAPGLYKIYPNVTRKSVTDKLKPFMISVCYLFLVGVPPIAVISGGTYRLVPSYTPVVLNGSESIDLNRPIKDSSMLKYQWKCSQTLKSPAFCTKGVISTRSAFVIPSKYIVEGEKFRVVLKIITTYDDKAEAHQEIEIIKKGILLDIRCEKNCPPASDWSNINSVTFLSVRCLKNCDDVEDENYVWSITKKIESNFTFDYVKDTQFGKTGKKFVIKKNVLVPDEYLVTVNNKDEKNRKGEATLTLIFSKPPEVTKCEIIPDSGESLKTYFSLECDQEVSFQRHLYELFVTDRGEDISTGQLIVSDFHPEIQNKLFFLPSSADQDFTVKITAENGPFTLMPVHPEVQPSLSGKSSDQILKSLKETYEGTTPDKSLSKMMRSTNPKTREKGLQTFQALVNELVDVKKDDEGFREFVENFKYQAVDDLLRVPFDSVRDIVKVGDSVTRLLTLNEANKSDPLLAKFSSTVCKKMGQKHVELMRKERFPLANSDLSHKVANVLSKCLEANTNPNFDIIEPLSINVTTPEPVLLEPIVAESYPDYQDFGDDYYKHVENLQATTNNIFEGSTALAKAMALTAAVGEKPSIEKGKISEILTAKDKAAVLAKMKLESNGVAVVPSQELIINEHPIDILLTTWTRDIFWWNPNHTKIATNIVHIEFWHSTCADRIRNFDKPADIFLDLNRHNLQFEIVEDLVQVPEGYTNMFHQDLNRHIYVRRVALPRGRTLFVSFHSLSTVLYVVGTAFKFPTIEDFAPPKTFLINDTSAKSVINRYDYDIWAYIGVLPQKEGFRGKASSSFQVEMSFVATGCIRWKATKTQWEPACSAGARNNLSLIHCRCNNFSTIAGHIQNVKSIAQEVIHEDFVTELQKNLVIFISVASTIGLYCFLLFFKITKRKKKATLYFLADNVVEHRYAYLVMIVTGKRGTTSHVTIRITGERRTSPAHVLNYPDPRLRLLQKNCRDVFVVTNQNHLGEILEVDLWFDCAGPNPSWYCEEIEIYDLQLKKSWYFRVKKLFSAQDASVSLNLVPTQRVYKTLKKISVFNGFHTWCFWAHETNFSYVKRLTVVVSNILLMAMIILMLHKVPEMEIRDGFDLDGYIFGWFYFFTAVVGSLVSFSIHNSISWIFRFSQIQDAELKESDKFSYSVTKTCWRVLIASIVTSSTFLVARGFWVPFNRSLLWLTACGIGLALQIFVYETIFIIIISFFQEYETIEEECAGEQFEKVVTLIHQQRYVLLKSFGSELLRPFVEHLHKPLEKKQIKERKLRDNIRQHYAEELTDLIMFSIYIIILYIVILVNKDSRTVVSQKEIVSMFQGKHTRTLPFTSIGNVQEMYQFINQTLIPVMQPQFWYEGLTISEPGMTLDFVNKFIGVARFRQQRIVADDCELVELMRFLNVTKCMPEYAWAKAETRHFGYGWGNFSSTLVLDRLRSIWQFLSEPQTQTLTFIGKFAAYSGGGYVAYLGRNLRNSYVNFRKMVVKLWIDQKTRSFFVEFLTYNANYNMLSSVRLLWEQSATGYDAHTIDIYSARMLFVQNETERMTIVFFAMFVVWVMVLLLKSSIHIYRHFRNFYKDSWLLVDIVIVILSLICIVVYMVRSKMVGDYLDALELVRHNEFINYFVLFYLEDFLTVCAAFLVLISTARLWKFLRFGLFFRIMERTLSSATSPLMSLNLVYFSLLLGFGLSGLMIYGNEFPELSSLLKIITSLILLSLKPDQFDITKYTGRSFGYWYFSSYLFLMQVILFVYVTIIIMCYVRAQLDFSVKTVPYSLRTFVQEQVQYIPRYFQQKYDRIRGGEGGNLVIPKSDELRYANSMSIELSTLKAMKCVLKCIIRNSKKSGRSLTTRDVKLMLEVCQRLAFRTHEEDQTEIFFKGHFVGETVRLIDERRIRKVAEVVEFLLESKRPSSLKKKKKTDSKYECMKIIKESQKTLTRCSLKLQLIYCNLKDINF